MNNYQQVSTSESKIPNSQKSKTLVYIQKAISILLIIIGLIAVYITFMQYILPGIMAQELRPAFTNTYILTMLIPFDILLIAHLVWPLQLSRKTKIVYSLIYLVIFLIPFIKIFYGIEQKWLDAMEINRFQSAWQTLMSNNIYLIAWLIPLFGLVRIIFTKVNKNLV